MATCASVTGASLSGSRTTLRTCGKNFGDRYGDVASGFIHVHHTTPVSVFAPGTVVAPAHDLIPLSPNCPAVEHLRDLPFSVEELRNLCHSDNGHDSNLRDEPEHVGHGGQDE